MVPGALGFLWLIAWRWLYYPPEQHNRISQAELAMIVADKQDGEARKPAGEKRGVRAGAIF